MITYRDWIMFALYIIAMALGLNMMSFSEPDLHWLGVFQVVFIGVFFVLRVYLILFVRPARKR